MTVQPDPPTSVLILHGWQNHRPPGHWQHLLADDLRPDGPQVRYPQLPDPDTPDWARWRAAVADELAALAGPRRAVIAHSLAAWVVLSLLVEPNLLAGMRILLVAPVARETLVRNPPIAAFDRGLDDPTLRELIVRHAAPRSSVPTTTRIGRVAPPTGRASSVRPSTR